MKVSKSNIINGIVVFLAAVVLYLQTIGQEDAFMTEGVHPMDYPRILIILLFILSFFISFTSKKIEEDHIPIITRRTVSMCLVLILFGVCFEKLGFAVCIFSAMVLSGLIMGYERYVLLCGISAALCACIWIVFTHVLQIPLSAGTIW
jgi:hypothetical protein